MRRLATLLLVALALAGCGGSGSKRLSRQEFVTKANGVCRDYYGKLNKLGQPKSPAALGPFIDEALPLVQAELKSLRAVSPPASDQAAYDRLLAQAQRENDIGEHELKPAVDAHDAAKTQQVSQRLAAEDGKFNATATALGLSVCAQSSSTG